MFFFCMEFTSFIPKHMTYTKKVGRKTGRYIYWVYSLVWIPRLVLGYCGDFLQVAGISQG